MKSSYKVNWFIVLPAILISMICATYIAKLYGESKGARLAAAIATTFACENPDQFRSFVRSLPMPSPESEHGFRLSEDQKLMWERILQRMANRCNQEEYLL